MVTLGSGSKGNCTYLGDGHAGVLIDCGISTKQIFQRLDAVGMGDAPIDAVLVTHEHSDHVGSARVLCNALKKRSGRWIPFHMTPGTHQNLHSKVVPAAVEPIEAGTVFSVRHLKVDPFPVPHDTEDPVGYRVCSGSSWAGVITDLGRPTHLVEEKLRSLSLAVLEFNHDLGRLMGGRYPWPVKQRIRNNHGHLSNLQAADLLDRALPQSCIQHLVLGHLSDENNTPQLAKAAALDVLARHDAVEDISLQLGEQRMPTQPLRVRVQDW
jgi:phosphoribosyl 1,2-cyclic phosphodiesterase